MDLESRTPRTFFGSLFSQVFKTQEPAAAAEAPDPLSSTSHELQIMLERVAGGVQGETQHTEGTSATARRDEATAEALRDRDARRDRLAEDVLALHGRLGSGLVREDLQRLRRILEAHAVAMDLTLNAAVEEQIEAAVLDDLYARTGESAWERLEALLTAAGVAWPVPGDLGHGRTDSELKHVLAQHRTELRTDFIAMPPPGLAALICGEVPSWPLYYPEPGSPLWRETVLRAVAAALRVQFFATALEVWLRRPADLTAELQGVLQANLARVHAALREGISSVDGARQVTAEVQHACRVLLPQLVWSYVAPRLTRGAPEASESPQRLENPVCWMLLTPEEAAATLSWAGQTFYFCSRSCHKRFEADPDSYARHAAAERH